MIKLKDLLFEGHNDTDDSGGVLYYNGNTPLVTREKLAKNNLNQGAAFCWIRFATHGMATHAHWMRCFHHVTGCTARSRV